MANVSYGGAASHVKLLLQRSHLPAQQAVGNRWETNCVHFSIKSVKWARLSHPASVLKTCWLANVRWKVQILLLHVAPKLLSKSAVSSPIKYERVYMLVTCHLYNLFAHCYECYFLRERLHTDLGCFSASFPAAKCAPMTSLFWRSKWGVYQMS